MKVIKIKLSSGGMKRIIVEQDSKNRDIDFIQCLWKYVLFSKNINRMFITCPFCNDIHSFKNIYDVTKCKKCNLIYNYEDAIVKVGNSMMFVISEDKKIVYMIPDLYFHFFVEHNMIPKEKFRNAVLHGIKPGTEEYFNYVRRFFLNSHERKLIRENKLIIEGVYCKFCQRELQGQVAYRISEDYRSQICSYSEKMNRETLDDRRYKYICYECGHYI